MKRTISYMTSTFGKFNQEVVEGSALDIVCEALQTSWVVSRPVDILGDDGFPDETFGEWGTIECKDEGHFLSACMHTPTGERA